MGDLTKNISRHELACKCGCGLDSMDYETINLVQSICDYFAAILGVEKVMLRISSAARCYTYNSKPVADGGPGSNHKSQHPRCRAIDFTIDGTKPQAVANYAATQIPSSGGIGRYKTFTHVDTRQSMSRWNG